MRIDLPDSVRPWKKSSDLTSQEFQILGLAVAGRGDTQISEELGISRQALASIWRRIHSKFGSGNRHDVLAKYAERVRDSQTRSFAAPTQQIPLQQGDLMASEAREAIQRKLLNAISDASVSYINGRQNVRQVYSRILDDLMSITQSHYGLIAEVHQENGIPYVGEHALTCSGWDASAQATYEASQSEKLLFGNVDPLFSEPMRTLRLVIENEAGNRADHDIRPEGHPQVLTFMGIPVYSGLELVGVIGLANRRDGYSPEMAEFLKPLVCTCANITVAWRLEMNRRLMQRDLDVATNLMRNMVERSLSATLYENSTGTVEFVNQKYVEIFGLEVTPSQVVGMASNLFVQHSKKLFADPQQFLRRVENLIDGQESSYNEFVKLADGRSLQRDFVVVRSGNDVQGYFWHYREQ